MVNDQEARQASSVVIYQYFQRAEKRHPQLAQYAPELVLQLLAAEKKKGGNNITATKLRQQEGNVHLGFAVLGDWLAINGFGGGFKVKLSGLDQLAIEGAKLSGIIKPLPGRETFLRDTGLSLEDQAALQKELGTFSAVVRRGLELGFTPKNILGSLLHANVEGNTHASPTLHQSLKQLIPIQERPQIAQILHGWIMNK